MQTILGATGQIGRELALELHKSFTQDIRLVSRNPQSVNESDQLVSADLLDAKQTQDAVAGSSIVYLTAGLPLDTQRWVNEWPIIMDNVIAACAKHQAKLVHFDNTYMYPQTSAPQTESTPFKPHGKKGKVRAEIVTALQTAMDAGRIEALICRAPEFYGPGKTQGFTNFMVIHSLLAGKPAKVFLRDDVLKTLIYTPDASRAMAQLGNTEDAYGQTWHLPCDDNRLTYAQFIQLAADIFKVQPKYTILKRWQLWIGALTNKVAKDGAELLPRYGHDNIFISDKFKKRFPDFKVTTYTEGLSEIMAERSID